MKSQPFEIIAEVKTQSPFGYTSEKTWDELFEVANAYGDIISIHTDARWGGSFDQVSRARDLTSKPILAKGIHASDEDIVKALDYGADFILVVGREPEIHLNKCLIEPNTLDELRELSPGTKVVWNSRDLVTSGLKNETYTQARNIWKGWLCQASNITSIRDVYPDADAVLVGEHLEHFVKSL